MACVPTVAISSVWPSGADLATASAPSDPPAPPRLSISTVAFNVSASICASGRTLLMATVGTHAINPALYKKLPYDAVKDFTPIALVAMAPVTIVVHPSLQANNLAELVSLAKSSRDKLNYGSAGAGTPGNLTGEMFKAAAGIGIQHVPYRGSAPGLTDLIAGQIPIMFDPLQSVLSNVLAGKLRALAISSKYGFQLRSDDPDNQRIFASLRALSAHIERQRKL